MSFLVFHSSFISNKDLLKVQKSYKNKVGKFIHNDRIGYVTWCAPRHPREDVLEPESPQWGQCTNIRLVTKEHKKA